MNKVYVLPPREDWIVDRFVKEWNEDNRDISVFTPRAADVVWLLADWCSEPLAQAGLLHAKKVITTVHHIVPEKFGLVAQDEFARRDKLTTVYHVYNQRAYDFIKPLTLKPIFLIKYWANNKIWFPTGEKLALRKRYNLPTDAFVIGSFQRDTEGAGIAAGHFLPKLEKGPDLFCDYVERMWENNKTVYVVLAGWRRQYIIERFKKNGIPFTYMERPHQYVINELYQTLDVYPVTARQEGGPQSLIECGLLNVPVISRPVGIAEQVLPVTAIADDVYTAAPAIPNVEDWKLPHGYQPYRDLIESL